MQGDRTPSPRGIAGTGRHEPKASRCDRGARPLQWDVGFISSPRAVCLLSGGLDSATCLALARRDGYQCYALSFDYGQRHKIELEAAARVAAALGAERHMVAKIGLDAFGGSALTSGPSGIEVPKGRSTGEMGEGIPVTYVPARNTIFLSFALAWAEVLASSHIFIGVTR